MQSHNTTIKKLVYSYAELEHATKVIAIYSAWGYKTIDKRKPTETAKGFCMMIKNEIEKL
jgi:hypothetical protein